MTNIVESEVKQPNPIMTDLMEVFIKIFLILVFVPLILVHCIKTSDFL